MTKERELFTSVCRALWGDEWHRHAAAHLGKSRRTIVYWANGEFAPKDWDGVFLSLLGACGNALIELNKRQQCIIGFKKGYSGGGR